MQTDQLPAQSRDAERSVLGSCLRDNAVIDDVAAILPRPEAFYFDAHQKIYRVILGLRGAGKPVDAVLLAESLHAAGQLEDAGRGAYLGELWDASPTAANAEYYARIIRDKALLRNTVHVLNDLLRQAYEGKRPAEDLLAEAEERVLQLSDFGTAGTTGPITLGDSLAQALAEIDRRIEAGRIAGIGTGMADIDRIVTGFQDGELTIIAARPSVGKTAMAAAILRHVVCELGIPAMFFTMEQSHRELSIRLLCAETRLNSKLFRGPNLTPEEISAVLTAREKLAPAPLLLDDRRLPVSRLVSEARKAQRKHGIRFVIVDYLQYIPADDEGQDRRHQIGRQSKALKALARELSIPVVCLAQLNRQSAGLKDAKPKLNHINESGEVEQDADAVWLLHRPDRDVPQVEVEIAKNRNGPTGEAILYYRKSCMRFENYTAQSA